MKNKIFLATLAILLIAGVADSQLQQSGGPGSSVTLLTGSTTAVTQTTGTNLHTVVDSGSITATQATGSNLHTVVDSGTITTVGAVTSITNALPAGTNVIGTVDAIDKTACGNTVASQALAAVPTSSTAVFTSTTCLRVILMNNTNSSAVTVTVTDNQGTPINDILTFSIPANSQLIQPLWGVAFTSGVKWSASTTGVTGAVLGYQ